jgi:hypothetical protein
MATKKEETINTEVNSPAKKAPKAPTPPAPKVEDQPPSTASEPKTPVMTTVTIGKDSLPSQPATPEVAGEEQPSQASTSANTPPTAESTNIPAIPAPSETQEEKDDPNSDPVKSSQVDQIETDNPATGGEEEIELEKKNSKLYVFGIILAIIVLAATIVALYIRAKQAIDQNKETETAQMEEVVEPVAPPEPTPIPRGDISLDILNGSGESGLAGSTADTFKDLGYAIYQVGNANSTEGNQVYINPDLNQDLLTLLFEDLLEELDISSSSGELKDSTASAQIVLGS